MTFAEDWEYTRQYISILQQRFGERLCWTAQIEPSVQRCLVPKLMLQPVIENAVTYGFETKETLHLHISAGLERGQLVTVIENDGDEIPPHRLEEIRMRLRGEESSSHFIGLYNIHRRAQLLYGEECGVSISSSPEEGTMVRIEFPAKEAALE